MNQNKIALRAIVLAILLVFSGISAYLIWSVENKLPLNPIRVACVGDSITQSTAYPYDLWKLLGSNYTVKNSGAGSTTVSLDSETPYMNTSTFQNALEFKPDIVIIMLGTNDAQPNLENNNVTFVGDYVKLVQAFQALTGKPKIWIALPPPLFSNQSGKIDPEYLSSTVIPNIETVANNTGIPLINVYAVLNSPNYFRDGEHPNDEGAQLIADTVYKAMTSQEKLKVV
jgi:lysophospholipase L1-like esterase